MGVNWAINCLTACTKTHLTAWAECCKRDIPFRVITVCISLSSLFTPFWPFNGKLTHSSRISIIRTFSFFIQFTVSPLLEMLPRTLYLDMWPYLFTLHILHCVTMSLGSAKYSKSHKRTSELRIRRHQPEIWTIKHRYKIQGPLQMKLVLLKILLF